MYRRCFPIHVMHVDELSFECHATKHEGSCQELYDLRKQYEFIQDLQCVKREFNPSKFAFDRTESIRNNYGFISMILSP